ncbi:putative Transcription initiation factor TFIID subunit 11 [Tripterygium wilfordii]|uniref:Putative Transcription initiation factor TFIID subunit 11 n=1 Tax=Tripterygium wilfordii TaxID=458696 RepID=A0A7J7C5S1_TRIWF|nr:uncharacterized protein LOC119988815 isoform X2 [Tripterygium wilfordii]XP_038689932.1 uncharacterized protein LOC119988815 isoform X2 [Tripterygium wilfordii]KAF5729177.1 putative Transcription initiation factor TFIID subunit 11 [Tripterygium wilfordii]
MGERKLNFNVPLLSVRRFSTPTRSPNGDQGKAADNSMLSRRHTLSSYMAEPDLEQVTEPATVPFFWEQTPGRPKDGGPLNTKDLKVVSATSRLPSRRALEVENYSTEKHLEDRNVSRPQIEAFPSVGKMNDEEVSGSENNDDDVYSDALDTLSPSDSCSMKCSVTGLSTSDELFVRPSGTFSTDPQTRDFMMSRFLPAAKAMALEPHQYASRKQPVTVERPRQVKAVVSGNRKSPVNQYESSIIPHYSEEQEGEESEIEDENNDHSGNISAKACGFIPRLCFKNSLCLLNPVPGIKIHTHASMSSTYEVGKSTKAACIKSNSHTVKKHAEDAVYNHKSHSRAQSPKRPEVDSKLRSGSSRFSFSSDRQAILESSPFRRSRGISPYRNETPRSPFSGRGFLGVPQEDEDLRSNRLNLYNKGTSMSQELLCQSNRMQGSRQGSPMVEKTLYVDTVHIARKSYSKSGPLDAKGRMDSMGKNFKAFYKSRELEKSAISVSSPRDVKGLKSMERAHKLEHTNLGSNADSDCRVQADIPQDSYQQPKLECIKVNGYRNKDVIDDQSLKADDNGTVVSVQPPLQPPLPKTPSESWLWRTLPSITSRIPFTNSHLGSQFHPKKQHPDTSSPSSKWETIVKSSHLHHDHVRCSEELVNHASQHYQT